MKHFSTKCTIVMKDLFISWYKSKYAVIEDFIQIADPYFQLKAKCIKITISHLKKITLFYLKI